MDELREKVARALAKADGKDPDAPAWVQGYGNRERTFGICWRDQYADKAEAVLAIPEIASALRSYEKNNATYLAAKGHRIDTSQRKPT